MSRNAQRNTRKTKEVLGAKPQTKEKFSHNTQTEINDFTPTEAQKVLINKIRENTLVFVDAPAGSGKSSTIMWHFAKEYLVNRYKQIMVVRTPVEFCDDKIGFLPNGLDDKLEVHFASTKQILEQFLGTGRVAADTGSRIHFKIPNFMLGCTLKDTLLLVDEAQQISPKILKLILERIGEGCKVVVAGSSEQLFDAHNKRDGLADAVARFFDYEEETDSLLPRFKNIAYHEFDVEDCMRDEIVKDVIRAYRGE